MRLDLTLHSPGLVTAVGYDVEHSCASLRAGISKASEFLDYLLPVAGGDDLALVTHRAELITSGFLQTGLWLQLLGAALDDVKQQGSLPDPVEDPGFWKATALCVNLPFPAPERLGWPGDRIEEIAMGNVVTPLRGSIPFPDLPPGAVLSFGPAGLATALGVAPRLLESPAIERVLILAADSYNDASSIQYLAEADRLFTPDQHLGVQPGEAGAALLLERGGEEAVTRFLSSTHAEGPGQFPDPEEDDLAPFVQDLGRRLAAVTEEAIREAGIERLTGDIIYDLSGESWRAQALGWAQVMLTDAGVLDFENSTSVIPATSFGEIGAASAVAGVCVAERTWRRCASPHSHALVLSLSPEGDAAAIVLERAPARGEDAS